MDDSVGPEEVRAAAAACKKALSDLVDRDWSVRAGGLDWSCRQTLEHIPNTQIFYASQLATAAKDRLPLARGGQDKLTVAELLLTIEVNASVLEHVIRAAPESTRAFHPAGMADASGFAAMGCDEILIHTADIAAGLGIDFNPPEDLCGRVLARLFPWAPTDVGHWDSLRWANGRISLPGSGPQDENWRWHCAPLSEWDGQIPRRT
ncbi:MAG: DinB family protein [Chloroflexi bacterium]|nr:DinB family protein [Chloroflexota bacterium]